MVEEEKNLLSEKIDVHILATVELVYFIKNYWEDRNNLFEEIFNILLKKKNNNKDNEQEELEDESEDEFEEKEEKEEIEEKEEKEGKEEKERKEKERKTKERIEKQKREREKREKEIIEKKEKPRFGGNNQRNAFAAMLAGKFGGGMLPGMPRPANLQKKNEPKPEIKKADDLINLLEKQPIQKKDKKKPKKINFSE